MNSTVGSPLNAGRSQDRSSLPRSRLEGYAAYQKDPSNSSQQSSLVLYRIYSRTMSSVDGTLVVGRPRGQAENLLRRALKNAHKRAQEGSRVSLLRQPPSCPEACDQVGLEPRNQEVSFTSNNGAFSTFSDPVSGDGVF
ncbi:hypothetical protein K456DRAFT_1421130 [Colletotrichum gloeosporioides 23]|nr:hypothetical protein K456DRAFT_1421130 [Colletotrichum gloeosporioides 23]